MSTRRSAAAATAAPCSTRRECRVIGIDRDPDAARARPRPGAPSTRRSPCVHAPFGELRQTLGGHRPSRPSTASCSTSASRPSSSTRASAASPSRPTARSTCAWRGAGRPRPISSTASTRASWRGCCAPTATSRRRARSPAPSSSARRAAPITTTAALAALVARAKGGRQGPRDPATRTFQALRIAVNDELGELERGLAAAETLLRPSGRLVVVVLPFRRGRAGQALRQRARRRGRPSPRGTCRRSISRRRAGAGCAKA